MLFDKKLYSPGVFMSIDWTLARGKLLVLVPLESPTRIEKNSGT